MKTMILTGVVILAVLVALVILLRRRHDRARRRGCEHCADQAEVERPIL